MKLQRGGFVIGMVVGLLVGLAIALAVALYITKAPVPFVNKVPQRTAEQDQAEAERNKNWDPNAPLAGRNAPKPAAVPASGQTTVPGAAPPPAAAASSRRDPAAILAGAPATPPSGPAARPATDAFVYFVQAGAFTRAEDAEQQRAKLAILGYAAKVTEREQAGRVVYRVRLGPFETRAAAEGQQTRLADSAIESQLVRVERP